MKSKTTTKNNPLKIEESKKIKSALKIPDVKELTDKERVQIYLDEIQRKDKRIEELEQENRLLLNLTMKNTKRRLEELEGKVEQK